MSNIFVLKSVSNIQMADTQRTQEPTSARNGGPANSEAATKSTLNDLLETLKKLEEVEHFVAPKPEKKNAWRE